MLQALRSELPHALWLYFWRDRTLTVPVTGLVTPPSRRRRPLPPSGSRRSASSASSSPCAHVRRDGIWLALATLGLLVPCFSKSTARRFLVFDLGWCALAAIGLLALLDAARFRAPARRAVLTTAVGAAFAAYGFALTRRARRAHPAHYPSVIPFGESGFSDGDDVSRLQPTGEPLAVRDRVGRVRRPLRRRSVSREPDGARAGSRSTEDRRAGGRDARSAFVEYYSLVANADMQPPRPGPIRDPAIDEVTYLTSLLDLAQPETIRWAFAQPSGWSAGSRTGSPPRAASSASWTIPVSRSPSCASRIPRSR
jgi:hypothetical protein